MKYLIYSLLAALLCSLLLWPRYSTGSQESYFTDIVKQHERNIEHKKYAALFSFFRKYRCPQPYYITNYIHAADKNNIDYRILPAISLQESSCGRRYPLVTNNLWGWNSANSGFGSIPEGIDFISQQLATGRYYKGKSLINQLRAYNPNPEYGPKIIKLMGEIK